MSRTLPFINLVCLSVGLQHKSSYKQASKHKNLNSRVMHANGILHIAVYSPRGSSTPKHPLNFVCNTILSNYFQKQTKTTIPTYQFRTNTTEN